jgi:hypothetical protein
MDGLGRKQVQELDRILKAGELQIPILLAALDRHENQWPLPYIKETWDKAKLTIPIHDLSPAARGQLYQGFDPKQIKVFPQFILYDRKGQILRILEGYQTGQSLREVLEEIQQQQAIPPSRTVSGAEVPGLRNGNFEDWVEGQSLPTGWELRFAGQGTCFMPERTSDQATKMAEIRSSNQGKRQILFQRLADPSLILGKKVRLTAMAKSNGIGKPVVALAVPSLEESKFRLAPESPFITREGQEIPLRILTACDFDYRTSAWQALSKEILIPDKGKLFVVIVYLDNVGATGGAAQFDNICLEYAQ